MATDAAPDKAFKVMVGVAVLVSLVSLAMIKSRRATPQPNAMQEFDIQHDSLAETDFHREETEGENHSGDVVGYCCLCMNGWYAFSGRGDCKKHCFSVAFWNAKNLGRGGCKAKYKVTGDSGPDVTKKCHAMRTKDDNGKLTPGERKTMKLQADAKDCASLTNEDAPELGSESSDDEVKDESSTTTTTTTTNEPESEPETETVDEEPVGEEDEKDDGLEGPEEEPEPDDDDGDGDDDDDEPEPETTGEDDDGGDDDDDDLDLDEDGDDSGDDDGDDSGGSGRMDEVDDDDLSS